jgi:hypothetical protein
VACYCKYGNEILGSINGGEFLNYLSDYYPLKNNSLWSLLKNVLKNIRHNIYVIYL